MPLYEYQCERCGRFEVIRKFADAPLEACPTCGQPIQKLPSAPAIQFKGTGWYITDYARKPASGEAAQSSAAKESSVKDSGTKESTSKEATAPASASPSAPPAPAATTGGAASGGTSK